MHELKTVIGIRTHKWGAFEKEIYNYLATYFGKDHIYIVMDETKNYVEVPDHYNKISISQKYLKEQLLLEYTSNSRGLLWLCGDYFYYALSNQVDADYYWLIETDVRFTFNDATGFFNQFSANNHDALLCRFSSANEDWYWSKHAKLIDSQPYKCFFPLSRLSKKAITYCQLERRKLTSKCIESNSIHLYPNDEELVATTVHKHKLSVQSITDEFPDWFQHFTYTNMILHTDYLDKFPKNKILHPVRSLESIKNRLEEECYLTLSQRTSLTNYIKHLGQYLNHKELALILNDACLKYIKSVVAIPKHLLISENILNKLHKECKHFKLFKQSKLWIWNKNVVVLDVTMNNKIYTIEYIVNNNTVLCNVFSRDDNLNFINFLTNEFKLSSHASNNKITLLEKEINEDYENDHQSNENTYSFVHNTINIFNHFLSKFRNLGL